MQKSKKKLFKFIGVCFSLVVIFKIFGGNHNKTVKKDVVKNTKIESAEDRDARQLEEAINLQNERDIIKKARKLLYVVTNTTEKTADIYYKSNETYVDGRKDTNEIRKKYFVFCIDYLDDQGNGAAAADYCLLVKKDNPEVYIYYPDGKMKKYNSDEYRPDSSINNNKKSSNYDLNVNSTPKDVVESALKSMLTSDIDLFFKCNNSEDMEDYCRQYNMTKDQLIEYMQKSLFKQTELHVQKYNIKLSDFSITQPDNFKERSRAYVQVDYLGNVKDIDKHFEIPVYRAYNGKWYCQQD